MADKSKKAKDKVTTEVVGALGMPDFMERESIHMNLKDLKNARLGDYVEITLCGTVTDLSAPTDSGYSPPRIGIKVEERRISVSADEQAKGIRELAKDAEDD